METERAFNVVEQEVIDSGDKYMLVAWKSMRKQLVESQKQAANKQNTPCQHRHHYHDMGSIICSDCHAVLPM